MTIQFNDETFRDDYSFKNSKEQSNGFHSRLTKIATCTLSTWNSTEVVRLTAFMKNASM
jgi:hypothetical protein